MRESSKRGSRSKTRYTRQFLEKLSLEELRRIYALFGGTGIGNEGGHALLVHEILILQGEAVGLTHGERKLAGEVRFLQNQVYRVIDMFEHFAGFVDEAIRDMELQLQSADATAPDLLTQAPLRTLRRIARHHKIELLDGDTRSDVLAKILHHLATAKE